MLHFDTIHYVSEPKMLKLLCFLWSLSCPVLPSGVQTQTLQATEAAKQLKVCLSFTGKAVSCTATCRKCLSQYLHVNRETFQTWWGIWPRRRYSYKQREHIMMSNGFVVTSLLMLVFLSTAAAGDGHSPQVAAVHAVLTHWSHRDGPGF